MTWSRGRKGEAQGLLELNDPAPGGGLTGNHGNLQLVRENLPVDAQALVLGAVDLVERDHDRDPGVDHLQDKVKVPLEARRIHHADHQIGCRLVGEIAQEDIAGDRFVGRIWGKRIGAGKI
jgi:hypothetical protein